MITFPFTTKAILVDQPLAKFYVAALPAELLLQVAFSDVMNVTMKSGGIGYDPEGTQRLAQPRRLAQIAKYIDRTDAAFPNSIILAANFREDGLIEDEDPSIFDDDPTNVSALAHVDRRWSVTAAGDGCLTLTIPTADKLAAIIDGQHRLFAFAEVEEQKRLQMELLCSIYLDLPKPYQAQLFATINSTQKPVDKSLTYELFGYNISEESNKYWSPDKLAVFLTRKLATDLESPLRGRIIVAPKKDTALTELHSKADWQVSTAVVVEGILRLFSSNPRRDTEFLLTGAQKERSALSGVFTDKSPLRAKYLETNDFFIYTVVLRYLRACQKIFWSKAEPDSFILRTVGVQALFDVLRRVIVPRAIQAADLRESFFSEQLAPAEELNFSKDQFRSPSGSGRTIIRRAIEEALEAG